MKWIPIKTEDDLPKESGYYFIRSQYGQMSAFFDFDKKLFNTQWDETHSKMRWLDESIDQEGSLKAIDLVKDLAAWSEKYPRGRIYSFHQKGMDDELIALEERANVIAPLLQNEYKGDDLRIFKLERDNKALKSVNEQLTNHIEYLNKGYGLVAGLKPEHKCIPIARALMSEGRDWWLGKLTETISEFPVETHCLHLKTPLKDVVFLCNSGDFQQLSVLCRHALNYPIDESWMESMLQITKIETNNLNNNI